MRADPSSLNAPAGKVWDVVVCGAGLAGVEERLDAARVAMAEDA